MLTKTLSLLAAAALLTPATAAMADSGKSGAEQPKPKSDSGSKRGQDSGTKRGQDSGTKGGQDSGSKGGSDSGKSGSPH